MDFSIYGSFCVVQSIARQLARLLPNSEHGGFIIVFLEETCYGAFENRYRKAAKLVAFRPQIQD